MLQVIVIAMASPGTLSSNEATITFFQLGIGLPVTHSTLRQYMLSMHQITRPLTAKFPVTFKPVPKSSPWTKTSCYHKIIRHTTFCIKLSYCKDHLCSRHLAHPWWRYLMSQLRLNGHQAWAVIQSKIGP